MKIGIIGLGKLGLPVAIAIAAKGHDVVGYDIDDAAAGRSLTEQDPAGGDFNKWREQVSGFRVVRSTAEVMNHAELVFVAVQTPSDSRFDGSTRLPIDRQDFDYRFLREAVASLPNPRAVPVAIISTVLPGAIRRDIIPCCHNMPIVYNPFFIAMGTVVPDFYSPEFVLVGVHDPIAAEVLQRFYSTITDAPIHTTTIENAELIKVAYNTFIGMKIVFANTIMELCQHIENTDCDDISKALCLATDRLLSSSYMRGGMGDGGACHPRDQIALSWAARKYGLSFDVFDSIMQAREKQAEFLCRQLVARSKGMRLAIIGLSFKKDSQLLTGSAAVLCLRILQEWGHNVALFDPVVGGKRLADELGWDNVAMTAASPILSQKWADPPSTPHAFLVGCNHTAIAQTQFPKGSVVIDPWSVISEQSEVEVFRVGRR